MIFRKFTLRVIALVLLVTISGMLMVWSFTRDNLFVARFTFSIIWGLLIVYLITYVTQTNRTLRSFLDSLRYLDSVRTSTGKGKSFEELDTLYNDIIGVIRKVELDRETERQYFRYMVNHAGVGIISFNESGEVEIINEAAIRLLKIRQIKNISEFSSLSDALPEILKTLKNGGQKLLKLVIDNEAVGLSIRIAEYRVNARKIRLASVQNIRNELEEEELDAWQKLIRVLTHEIMNSITPVNSLTNTIIRLFEKDGKPKLPDELDEASIANALEGLHSIEKRNRGLIGFVQTYRSLTRIRKPRFTHFEIESLFRNISNLVMKDLESEKIRFSIDQYPHGFILEADEKLLEQVLINLINNSRNALKDTADPRIELTGRAGRDHIILEVRDNGCGIPDEILGSIFIPFFTTREEGSGIGLSLSRQIMRLHGGSISVKSAPGSETIFMLKLPV